MKKFTTFLFAAVAGLLVSTVAFAHGQNSFAFRGGYGHYNNTFAVRAFTFSQPVYARADAYFTYTPFQLVALPPVAQGQPAVQATYQAPAPVTYSLPTASYQFFGVRRFASFNDHHGRNALVRVDVNRFNFRGDFRNDFRFRGDFRGREVVQETRVFRGPLGGRVERTTTRVRGR